MDKNDVRSGILKLRSLLANQGIRLDAALLFGSRATETANPESDWDIALVSRDFGRDRFAEGSLVARLAFPLLPNCECVPLGLREYMDTESLSPILAEIKATGIPLI
jgi:predicted nucleotidyltransferase